MSHPHSNSAEQTSALGTRTPVVVEASTAARRIKRLPPLLVNQIAAGEVVDRPSSVVKELIDNAIDAGATHITVELESGGIELIRITDDGRGIHPDDLPLALAPHATSKIAQPDDLDRIATMGFRGEALASIASISRLSIRSRRAEDAGAQLLECEGDQVQPVRPTSGPVGTQVTVRNLFFNTPARRKFLRTHATEQGHCVDMAAELALSHPHIAVTVVCDGRPPVLDLGVTTTARERALAVLGNELASELIELSSDPASHSPFDGAAPIEIWGLIGKPSIAKATPKAQHIFLNGRPIRDKTIQHAVREAYRGLIEPGRYPTAVLMLAIDPASVDVNVHPAKTEVRFREQSLVHSTVLRSIRDALRGADLTGSEGIKGSWDLGMKGQEVGMGIGGGGRSGSFVENLSRPYSGPTTTDRFSFSTIQRTLAGTPVVSSGPPLSSNPGQTSDPAPPPASPVLQIHNSYLVTQDEHGILIIDQHALHERVMFEQLLERIGGGTGGAGSVGKPPRTLESQRLLVPAVVPATPTRMGRLEALWPLLTRIGIALEPLGPTSIGVQSFPTFLFERGVDAGEFVAELLERDEGDGLAMQGAGGVEAGTAAAAQEEETLHEVLDMMACKAAVKAGDRLSDLELLELLRLRETVERSSNCPHGRPTTIRLTIKELEKRFGRA